MKLGQYCQRQRCKHVKLEQFWHAFASRGFVSDSWAFLFHLWGRSLRQTRATSAASVESTSDEWNSVRQSYAVHVSSLLETFQLQMFMNEADDWQMSSCHTLFCDSLWLVLLSWLIVSSWTSSTLSSVRVLRGLPLPGCLLTMPMTPDFLTSLSMLLCVQYLLGNFY